MPLTLTRPVTGSTAAWVSPVSRSAATRSFETPVMTASGLGLAASLLEGFRETSKELLPTQFSRRWSVSAVEERTLLCVDEPRAGADGLEFHRAQRPGDVLAIDGHRVRHHDTPVRHDIE